MANFIGIYGGAFDPPHIAHIETAKQLIKERGYDKLILLPSHNPPHKSLSASNADRLAMLSLALDEKMEISELEINRNGVGYTAEYLPELIHKYGDNIEYIMGGDSFLNFDKWYKPLEILKLTKILVVARDGERDILFEKLKQYEKSEKKGIEIAKYLPKSISSSEIRDKLRLHMDVSDKLDEKILNYIKKQNLYNEYDSILTKLAQNLSEERLAHTKGVVLYALEYASKLQLDYNKVFLACLLHDSAKTEHNYDELFDKGLVPKDSKNTLVAHAFCGSIVAKQDYGVTDEQVLDAIFCHTTAKPNMTKLAKLVYVADMLESGRDFDGVEELRKITAADFEKGFFACLSSMVEFLKNGERDIYPLTLEAYEYYRKLSPSSP